MIRRDVLAAPDAAAAFVVGVTRLKDPARAPWSGGLSMYDFYVFWHHRAMMLATPPGHRSRNAAHSGPVFLPWHRYFLLMVERSLRDVLGDDDFRIPYWDWAADRALPDPVRSPLWGADLLGGTGNPVTSGAFAAGRWEVRLQGNPTARNPLRTSRGLRRELGLAGSLPTRDEVRALVRGERVYDQSPWDDASGGLRNRLEGWISPFLHNTVHVWVGGDMAISTSPNDPAFLLHHANVDRLWRAWQERNGRSAYLPLASAPESLAFHRLDDPMHTFFTHPAPVTPRTMLDADPWYRYDTIDDVV